MTIVHSLETHDDRLKLASDWSVSVDVLLTELKAPSFLIFCFFDFGQNKYWERQREQQQHYFVHHMVAVISN